MKSSEPYLDAGKQLFHSCDKQYTFIRTEPHTNALIGHHKCTTVILKQHTSINGARFVYHSGLTAFTGNQSICSKNRINCTPTTSMGTNYTKPRKSKPDWNQMVKWFATKYWGHTMRWEPTLAKIDCHTDLSQLAFFKKSTQVGWECKRRQAGKKTVVPRSVASESKTVDTPWPDKVIWDRLRWL